MAKNRSTVTDKVSKTDPTRPIWTNPYLTRIIKIINYIAPSSTVDMINIFHFNSMCAKIWRFWTFGTTFIYLRIILQHIKFCIWLSISIWKLLLSLLNYRRAFFLFLHFGYTVDRRSSSKKRYHVISFMTKNSMLVFIRLIGRNWPKFRLLLIVTHVPNDCENFQKSKTFCVI